MTRMFKAKITIVSALMLGSDTGLAGMPFYSLNDIAKLRLETISFFLLLLLLSALAVKLLWNFLRRDFQKLPHLNYPRALALVLICGLLFNVVLVMISGARELMTPGAWQKDGLIYKLNDQAAESSAAPRRQALEKLREHLWQYSKDNGGKLPESQVSSGFPDAVWLLPDDSGRTYVYFPAFKDKDTNLPIAYEPDMDGSKRHVLMAEGQIVTMDLDELADLLKIRK